jgi:hypothetical protein
MTPVDTFTKYFLQNQLNALSPELNSICHLLALLGAHHILYVSKIRVNTVPSMLKSLKWPLFPQPECCMQFSSLPCVNSIEYCMCKIGLCVSFEYNYELSDYYTGIFIIILHLGLCGFWSLSAT